MKQTTEDIVIELKNKNIVLKIYEFSNEIEVDEILKIDYNNMLGEILTFTVLFNRIANLKAEMEHIVSTSKFDLESLEAQLHEEYKKKLLKDGEKATEKSLEMNIIRDPRYIIKKKNHLERIKHLAYLDSLYWSAQNKSALLRSISDKMKPEEFEGEIVEGIINGIMIKSVKKSF